MNRWAMSFVVMGLGLGWGCAGKRPAVGPAPPVTEEASLATSPSDEERIQELIREAQQELARGEALLEQQNTEEARIAFDRAVDILLGVEGGAEEHPDVRSVYSEIIGRIHALETGDIQVGEADSSGETLWEEDLDSALAASEMKEDVTLTASDSPSPTVGTTYDLPIDYNKRVASIVEMFQERRRDWFQAALQRSGQHIDLARKVFQEEGLPLDLVYLGMVESAFKTRAVSRAGARGIWQFMSGTGRLYGLREDYWVDHRFDPEKSTRAAARHLKDLYDEFGDWYLVMAAYNAGSNRVKRAVARTGTRDFWELARTKHLRRETKSYVPLILATIVIAKDPERYGFDPGVDPPLEYDVVDIDAPMDLGTAAACAGTSLDEMKRLNPELRRWVTPLDRSEYSLKIPLGTKDAFCTAVAALPPQDRVRFLAYTVQRGDTLSHIARAHRTSVQALADANRITARSIIRPGQVLTVPVPEGAVPHVGSARRAAPAPSGEGDLDGDPEVDSDLYVVRRGDTLSRIAAAHGVELDSLRSWNALERRSLIHPGQKLIVRERAGTSGARRVVYRVRRGDTLIEIARRFSVRVEEIRRWNNLSNDRILAGDSLEIYTSGS